eukprot:768194-Hanusia_phi.AAC.3
MATAVEMSGTSSVQGGGANGGGVDDEECRMEQKHWTHYMESIVKESDKSLDQLVQDRELGMLIKSVDVIMRQASIHHEQAYATENAATRFKLLGNYYALMLRFVALVLLKMKNHPSYGKRCVVVGQLLKDLTQWQ